MIKQIVNRKNKRFENMEGREQIAFSTIAIHPVQLVQQVVSVK